MRRPEWLPREASFSARAAPFATFIFNSLDQSLSSLVSFTARPKFDPLTGDAYGFGISKSISPELKVFRQASSGTRLEELHSYRLGGFLPIHDMMLTKNYIVFVISPVRVDSLGAALGRHPIADLIRYDASSPLRILIFRRDGKGKAIEIESQPSAMIFHHCNAYEEADGTRIVFNSVANSDDNAYKVFASWKEDQIQSGGQTWITRFEVDLTEKKLISRTFISDGTPCDFPCADPRRMGSPVQYIHVLEARNPGGDPLEFNAIACHDLSSGQVNRIPAAAGHIWGEPVFVPHTAAATGNEQEAWILHLGYHRDSDETDLDIRSAVTLELVTRVWTG